MNGAGLLKSFLVGLQFKIDANSYQAFNRAVGASERGVRGLGTRAAWAAAAITGMVTVISRQLDRLYYISLRSEESAENIKVWGSGARFAGIEAGKAGAMIENLAMLMQTDPGKFGLMRALGVEGANATAQLENLVRRLYQMGPILGSRFGTMFGLEWGDIVALAKTAGERSKAMAEQRQFSKDTGINVNSATKAAHDLMMDLGKLVDKFALVGAGLVDAFGPEIKNALGWVNDLLTRLGQFAAERRLFREDMPEPGEEGYENPLEWFGKGRVPLWSDFMERTFFAPDSYRFGYDFLQGLRHADPVPDYLLRDGGGQQPVEITVTPVIRTNDPNTTVDTEISGPLGADTARNLGQGAR